MTTQPTLVQCGEELLLGAHADGDQILMEFRGGLLRVEQRLDLVAALVEQGKVDPGSGGGCHGV